MRRTLALVSSILLAAAALRAERVTLPAVASLVGGNPFFSDVRVFNTSYTDSVDVTATYRCFIGTAQADCPGVAPVLDFTLSPREARAFNDMVADPEAFDAHDTAGGVEFEYSGSGDQLVVTSRLYSTSPQNSVGMFIPGLKNSEAHPTTVLTSIRNTPATSGVGTFRTNVGVFNPEDSPVSVTFTIFDNGTNQVGTPVTRNVGGHSGVQVSGIFAAAGAGSVTTSNAVIVVSAGSEIFSYAAVLDNNTADPIFVVGAEDQPPQPITPAAVTPTPPPIGDTRMVDVGFLGNNVFHDSTTGQSTSIIHRNDAVIWVWASGNHSVTSGSCCTPNGLFSDGPTSAVGHTFTRQFTAAGNFPYFCSVHNNAGLIQVQD